MESDGIMSILLSFLFLGPGVSVFIIIYCFNLEPVLVENKAHQQYSKNTHKQYNIFFTSLVIGHNINSNISWLSTLQLEI